MNKILHLFDKEYVIKLLTKKVLPLYPDFTKISNVKIISHKDHVWETSYHVVMEFKTAFLTKDGKIKRLPIFCSAHSDEPRKNVHDSLVYLWESGFSSGYLTTPHPLFYSKYFKGTFYRGVEGNNLYHYIKKGDEATIAFMIPRIAKWFAKLHQMKNAQNFNFENSRIKTVIPGVDHILRRIKHDHPKYLRVYRRLYNNFIETEEKFLNSTGDRWLTHGDAHPENIIKMGKRKIAVIDFTDLCLTDFARDLGTFLQQFDFMCDRKLKDAEFVREQKQIFLNEYFANHKKVKYDDSVRERINLYYYWTAIRTATYFFLKEEQESKRAVPILKEIGRYYNIKIC